MGGKIILFLFLCEGFFSAFKFNLLFFLELAFLGSFYQWG